ncbi:AAA family ATPase [Cytophagaceae bacterium DM2B3-1]|uniref:AAA family ATPase n=1 Tax=Xanthocytophaga flava TaxID=3048013 RepID=A0ABT7CFY1_9BACT|nr:AAA family ATPase [Xanthocytophaga flavus]MDJ1472720.1 AAA family ATPase [Xanthocytophaga flavus]MDJ1491900.1 AAA family ATPase [Xanthocytophaga flavus]
MNSKIEEAQEILKEFGLPEKQQNKISALTLLALCGISPDESWQNATSKSLTLSKDIIEFVNNNYGTNYKANTRESFRKIALNPFVDNSLVILNPDDPNLKKTSAKTHYAISYLALNTIKKYKTDEWNVAVENFIKYKNQVKQDSKPSILLKTVQIKSYKSIVDDKIELGRFNVFIGTNGCGKTNILEALATVGAERGSDLTFDGLYSRGVRIARPDLILSSFLDNNSRKSSLDISLIFENDGEEERYKCALSPVSLDDIYTKWINLVEEETYPEILLEHFREITRMNPGITGEELLNRANILLAQEGFKRKHSFDEMLSEYAIFDLNTKSLRGVSPAESRKTPLGINGEGLDLLIASFNSSEWTQLRECCDLFDWLGEIIADKDDKLKVSGLKPGRSISTLYFRDSYMQKNNNTFSAENSNEGILHVLFYLALFISNKTPKLFAIDNIETALNPRLCQVLISKLVELSKVREKQTLITTHNPAILDGLNLLDDEQRLFEVYRDSVGRTKTRRLKFKSDLSDKKFKLSEMWLKGLLGAIPKNF